MWVLFNILLVFTAIFRLILICLHFATSRFIGVEGQSIKSFKFLIIGVTDSDWLALFSILFKAGKMTDPSLFLTFDELVFQRFVIHEFLFKNLLNIVSFFMPWIWFKTCSIRIWIRYLILKVYLFNFCHLTFWKF